MKNKRSRTTPIIKLTQQSKLLLPISLILVIVLWQLIVMFTDLPQFILPSPLHVLSRFFDVLQDGSLLRHTLITLSEVLSGLFIGAVVAGILGYLLGKSRGFERLFAPYIVASQSVPIVAIAPLLVIWFGPGLTSKILICALIVFFPILINTIIGIRSVPDDLHNLMRSLKATRWQMLTMLELPSALPVLFAGFRIGATLAVIGAVVGEFVGADSGLGFLINLGKGLYDTALVFVAIFTLVTLALLLYTAVILLENKYLAWQQPEKGVNHIVTE